MKKPSRAGSRRLGFSSFLAGGKPAQQALNQFLAAANQRAEPLGKQLGVERLLERLVNRRAVEAERAAVVGQQGDQDRLGEIDVLPQVLANLQRFDPAD